MRILVTGVSGLDRERAWLNVDNGSVFDLGSMMLALAKERHMDFDEDTILHAGQDTLAALRAAAIARINLSAGQNLSDEALIISTHSVFARVDGLAEGLLPADVKEIKPDLWVTLIDGPQTIDQAVMAEEFRAHDTGAKQLTAEPFKTQCIQRAQYRLGDRFEEVDAGKLEEVASLVYCSWEPMLTKADWP